MSSFHIWGREIEGNGGDTSAERPRIEVASDASLDEGAIIRTTKAGATPLAGPTGYFLGLDRPEAEGVKLALEALRESDLDTFDNYWGEMVLERVERLLGYIEQGDEQEGGDEPSFPAPLYPVGTRVRLIEDVERYPHFVIEKGATGTVATSKSDLFSVRLDTLRESLEEWENEIHWYMQGEAGDADDPRGYVEKIEPQADDFVNHSRLEQMPEAQLRRLVAEGGPSALIDAAQAEIDRRGEQAMDAFQAEQDRDFDAAEGRRTLTAVFDVTGLTDREVGNLAGAVEVQAETNKEAEPYFYPSVTVLKVEVNPPLADEEPRTILVHLNIELPADAPATTDDVVREIEGALEVGIDENPPDGATGNTPALLAAKITVPLAEEI